MQALYVRIDNRVFLLSYDDAGRELPQRQLLKTHDSISQAKKWSRMQFPGSVRVEEAPHRTAANKRRVELQRLIVAQATDRALSRPAQDVPSATLPRPHVAADSAFSSFLRERTTKRNVSRNRRNGRPGIGRT